MVTIKINGKEKLYEDGIKYEIIAEEHQNEFVSQIALVTVNGKIRELMKRVDRDCDLEFITYADQIGHKTYVRTAIMLMLKAIKDVAGMEVMGQCESGVCHRRRLLLFVQKRSDHGRKDDRESKGPYGRAGGYGSAGHQEGLSC